MCETINSAFVTLLPANLCKYFCCFVFLVQYENVRLRFSSIKFSSQILKNYQLCLNPLPSLAAKSHQQELIFFADSPYLLFYLTDLVSLFTIFILILFAPLAVQFCTEPFTLTVLISLSLSHSQKLYRLGFFCARNSFQKYCPLTEILYLYFKKFCFGLI